MWFTDLVLVIRSIWNFNQTRPARCVTAKSCTLGFPMQPGWLQKILLLQFLMQPRWLQWKLKDAIFVLLACNQPGCIRNPRMQPKICPGNCFLAWWCYLCYILVPGALGTKYRPTIPPVCMVACCVNEGEMFGNPNPSVGKHKKGNGEPYLGPW